MHTTVTMKIMAGQNRVSWLSVSHFIVLFRAATRRENADEVAYRHFRILFYK